LWTSTTQLPRSAPFGNLSSESSTTKRRRLTLANYLDLAVSFDLPQHGWDLAKATLQDPTIDPKEVGLLWSSLLRAPQVWDWQRENGWYAAPVSVPSNAPLQDRVLGLIGRDPGWTPGT
jgi:hypothetical protein